MPFTINPVFSHLSCEPPASLKKIFNNYNLKYAHVEKASYNLGLPGKSGWGQPCGRTCQLSRFQARLRCPAPQGHCQNETSADARGCVSQSKSLPGLLKDLFYFDLGRWMAPRHVQVIKWKRISSSNFLGFELHAQGTTPDTFRPEKTVGGLCDRSPAYRVWQNPAE